MSPSQMLSRGQPGATRRAGEAVAQVARNHADVAGRCIAEFAAGGDADLFEKCRRFAGWLDAGRDVLPCQYQLTLRTPLDHRIVVVDPFTGRDREMICFDSNSYLGLHLHPRVIARVREVVQTMGYGTPSAQLLGGTNTQLRALEELLAQRFGREDAVVYGTGYQTNIGLLTGLLRPGDLVLVDQFAHASIQDGCRWSGATTVRYPHADLDSLRRLLATHRGSARAALIATDGVFSMHGDIADLPGLRALADEFDARLMVDEAHSLGVIGVTGRGIEEHYGMPGAIDVLMGTFSKAPGGMGGYVAGDRVVLDYLRFFSHPHVFTAALPAQLCAGLIEALRVMEDEPQHRERLWRNARRLWWGLRCARLPVRPLESPIIAVAVGDESLIAAVGVDLFAQGIKCGVVRYPAVPRDGSVLRLTVCSRHTDQELDRTVEVLAAIGRKHGIAEG